jgi:hypothetical protein
MRTDSVSTIAGAHDARSAASRLGKPVPDGSRRAAGARHRVSARAATLGRGRRQLTPALLGIG